MSRPTKQGIDYFPMDVSFLTDIKIRKIMKACGPNSVAVLINLLCSIYREDGYYLRWDEDTSFLIAEEIGINEGSVDETVKKAVQVDFFNKKMFDENHILTSQGIQKRFKRATYQRKENSISHMYNLLDSYEKPSNLYEKPSNLYENHTSNQVNHMKSTQSKVKKSKVKESKEDSSNNASGGWESVLTWQTLWMFPNQVQKDDLADLINQFGDDLVNAAIKIAGSKDVKKSNAISFIESCLKEWADNHVTTLGQAREYQKSRGQKQVTQKKSKQFERRETLPDWVGKETEETSLPPEQEKALRERVKRLTEQTEEE